MTQKEHIEGYINKQSIYCGKAAEDGKTDHASNGVLAIVRNVAGPQIAHFLGSKEHICKALQLTCA